MRNFESVLENLHGLSYLIIGGTAVKHYVPSRKVCDLDIMISENDVAEVQRKLNLRELSNETHRWTHIGSLNLDIFVEESGRFEACRRRSKGNIIGLKDLIEFLEKTIGCLRPEKHGYAKQVDERKSKQVCMDLNDLREAYAKRSEFGG